MKDWSFEELKARGSIERVVVEEEFLARLKTGKPLKIYQGFDPTSPDLHIGHMVGFRVLRWFQLQGHKVIFLVGDGTGLVGDPSGRSKKREMLTDAIVKMNRANYKDQASKIIDFKSKSNPARLLRNSKWLLPLSLSDMLGLMSKITIQRLLERDMFQERLKNGDPLYYVETIYPLLQGFDSVAMKVDAELGATDQFFNMMVGRDLVREYLHKDKFVLTTPLIPGIDGETMSKTRGNTINLSAAPFEMFDKIMLLHDHLMPLYFRVLTDVPTDEIGRLEREAQKDPIAVKEQLATIIVSTLHSEPDARNAMEEFRRVRRGGALPEEMPTATLNAADFQGGAISTLDLLTLSSPPMVPSRSEARRLIEQKGVKFFEGRSFDSFEERLELEQLDGKVIQIGKRRFFKIRVA